MILIFLGTTKIYSITYHTLIQKIEIVPNQLTCNSLRKQIGNCKLTAIHTGLMESKAHEYK